MNPRGSSEAELRCNGTYDHGRECRRLLVRVYADTHGRVELYCTRCRTHHRVVVTFPSTGSAQVSIG